MSADRKADLQRLLEGTASIDREILERLNRRWGLSLELRALQEAEGEPLSLDTSDAAWLESLSTLSEGPLPEESLQVIFRAIRSEARGVEQPLRVAYVGPEGGFSYQLARSHFGSVTQLFECETAVAALDQVARGRAAHVVLPWESSVDGLVQASVTALSRSDLPIVAERSIAASYHLMTAKPDTKIERLFLTPLAHASCERFLATEYAEVEIVNVRSPLVAAQRTRATPNTACIVPAECGTSLALFELRSNVADVTDLAYRYFVIGTRPAMRTGNDTTCLLFGGDDAPGALYGILGQFSERGISLRRLQSRPRDAGSWQFAFYVEIAGHASDRAVVTALEAVKRSTQFLKVLGSFPSEN